jgi:hypothetical protein
MSADSVEKTTMKTQSLSHGLIVLLYLALSMFLFRAVFSEMPFGSDTKLIFYPERALLSSELRNGNLALWNPFEFCGRPSVGTFQASAFYPLTLIFYFLPLPLAFTVFYVVHVWFSGVFMYLFAYSLTRSHVASFAGGLVYMLGGFPLSHIYAGHLTMVASCAWAPLVFLLFLLSVRKRRLAFAALGGLVLGVENLAGYPAIAYYTLLGLALFSLFTACSTPKERRSFREACRPVLCLALIVVAGFLVSAVEVLPAVAVTQYSSRAGGTSYEFASSFSLPPENFITFLLPGFFGDGVQTPYWGRWLFWEVCGYAGILPIFLGLFLLIQRKEPLGVFFSVLGLGCILFAFGRYAGYFKLVYHLLPGLSMFRGPVRILMLFTFAAAVVTALGFAYVLDRPVVEFTKAVRKTALAGMSISFVLAVVFITSAGSGGGNSLFWKQVLSLSFRQPDRLSEPPDPFDISFLIGTYRNARTSVLLGLSVIAATGLLCLLMAYLPKQKRLLVCSLTAILLADLLLFGSRLIVPADPARMVWPEDLQAFFKAQSGVFRVAGISSRAEVLQAMAFGRQNAGGFNPAVSRRYSLFFNKAHGENLEEPVVVAEWRKPGRALDLMNVRFLIADRGQRTAGSLREVFTGKEVSVFENPQHLPRAFLVHRYEKLVKEEAILGRLFSPGFDPKVSVILEEDPGIRQASPSVSGKEDQATVDFYSTDTIRILTKSGSPSMLVLLDSFYPGWKAFVDGKPGKLVKADYLFRAVPLADGAHTVEMKYEPPGFAAGRWLSVFGLAVIAGLPIIENTWKRRSKRT